METGIKFIKHYQQANDVCAYILYFIDVVTYGNSLPDISFFLNHSDNPNIISINDGEFFETITDIKAGEELFIDYGEIV